ncbi:MAG TPA: DUF4382 domain-containing protein [Candidatus Deferrimicrobium sp.]|nr:DUF4382 domain-containing protein [Candidatus Deferrimicrobium sp.]
MERKFAVALLVIIVASAGLLSVMMFTLFGPIKILIKDAPYDDLVSINVDIAAVEIQKVDEARWITLMQGAERRLNCSVTGEAEEICKSDISAGTYDLMRINFNHIHLRFNNGSLYEVDKYENQNTVQNYWLEIPINFTYDGAGGYILFDITINEDCEAVVTIIQTVA